MNREIQFTQDYATHKKGNKWTASRDLTGMLVRIGVAEYIPEKPKKSQKKVTRKKTK